MKTMIVDDEPLAVEELADTCEQIEDVQIVGRFLHAAEALKYAEGHPVDLAFLDLSLIHISEPTRHSAISRMPSSA